MKKSLSTESQKIESAYMNGSRRAWLEVLSEALKHLGPHDPIAAGHRWQRERAETVMALRELCAEFGDLDWDEDLYLPDVIEKHLSRHLHGAD